METDNDPIYVCIHVAGLALDCGNSSALAMELMQSCTKPSMCTDQRPGRVQDNVDSTATSPTLVFLR